MDELILSKASSENNIQMFENRRKAVRQASIAVATRKAIEKHWRQFSNWCEQNSVESLPAQDETLEAYLIYLMDNKKKVSTIEQAKWAIDSIHKLNRMNTPGTSLAVITALKGIRRLVGSRQKRKEALTIEHIGELIFTDDLIDVRNKAMLLIGFAGGFRRSEIANIELKDVIFLDFGCRIEIPFSKTNQDGKEEFVDIVFGTKSETCPVTALQSWINHSKIQSGKVFRSISKGRKIGQGLSEVSIGKIVKKSAELLGLDPKEFGGHSLRAGCATYLLERDISVNLVAKQLRHKKIDTTLRYDRSLTSKNLKGVY